MRLKYAQIERFIASTQGLQTDDLEVMKAFRSRVRNFQKAGLIQSASGKGQKVTYTLQDAVTWIICFHLASLAYSPLMIKDILSWCGDDVISYILDKKKGKLLVIVGYFLGLDNKRQKIAAITGLYSLEDINKRNLFQALSGLTIVSFDYVSDELEHAFATAARKGSHHERT